MARNQQNAVRRRGGFSLIELVIVVVIIGIIAAIAIPRMSRGTAGAADSALSGNLTVLRNAVELYATEHGGAFPTSVSTITDQLTMFTNDAGTTSATKTGAFVYGPYLRKVPPITVGALKNDNTKNAVFGATVETTPTNHGWVYTASTGELKPNLPAAETDGNGKKYADY